MPKLTCRFRGKVLAVYHLENGRSLIGRAIDCSIQVDSLGVSPYQMELIINADVCQIKNLDSKNLIYLNGRPVKEALSQSGNVLQIGTHEFTFARDEVSRGTHLDVAAKKFSAEQTLELEPKVKKKGLSFVQIQSGEYIGRIMPLQENITHLGKAGGNRVAITRRVDNYYLSQADGDKVTINGLPVGMESILLRDGDLVQIGAIRCQFFN